MWSNINRRMLMDPLAFSGSQMEVAFSDNIRLIP
jgi:hypothetical protein